MARYDGCDSEGIYQTARKWREHSLLTGDSLLWPNEQVWTLPALKAFKSCFVDRPDDSSDSFEVKYQRQLKDQDPIVTKLGCELLLVYFLFTMSVRGVRKRELITTVAGWKSLTVDDQQPAMMAMNQGIGGTGQAFSTRRPFEIAYLARVALHLLEMDEAKRSGVLNDHAKMRAVLDTLQEESTFATRHILLHLLYPEYYERTASGGQKRQIAEVFGELAGPNPPDDLDEQLHAIRSALQGYLPNESLDFYREPLRACWYESGESDELGPAQALAIKRQIVLYGPPGTGKTHEAKELAATLVRQGVLHAWKPKRYFADPAAVNQLVETRVRRIQLHPGYGYEDLIRGLHLSDGGKTEYRNGVLLQIIADIEKQPSDQRDLPFVVILDEMNRADLSKVLGECFSLLEDRDGAVQLAGQDREPCLVRMPPNLYFIGTMNLIDQSLEQVDFALRRRFLWFFRGFSREDFLAVSEFRWKRLRDAGQIKKPWDRFEDEFEILADRAEALNAIIEDHHALGPHYQIGHTYFCDVVSFASKALAVRPGKSRLLFNKKNEAADPVADLWKYSLQPLLEQYLSGVDETDRKSFLKQAQNVLLKGKS